MTTKFPSLFTNRVYISKVLLLYRVFSATFAKLLVIYAALTKIQKDLDMFSVSTVGSQFL